MKNNVTPSIGLLSTIAKSISAAQLEKFKKIENLNFNLVRKRLLVDFPNYTENELDEIEQEVKRFLAVVLFEKTNYEKIVVSEKIDCLWHYFFLHTHEYQDFCNEVYGAYLNHVPILPEEKHTLATEYVETRNIYKKYFGQPPVHLWGENHQICWGGCPNDDRKPRVNQILN